MLGFVIGDSDMITGFRLVGIEGIEVSSADEAFEALNRVLIRNDLAVLIINQQYSSQQKLRETIDNVRRERRSPLIVEVPGSKGKPSEIRLSDLISKSLGVRV